MLTLLILLLNACQCNPGPGTDTKPSSPEAPAAPEIPEGIVRIGAPPAMPAAKWEEDKGACAHRIRLRELSHISDSILSADGVGKATPVVLLEDGAPMKGFAKPDDYRERCTGSFAFPKNYLVFSPSDQAGAAAHSYELALAESVPMQGPGGETYWVYPGTTLQAPVPEGMTGEVEIFTSVRAYGDGVGAPSLSAGGVEASLEQKGGSLQATLTADARVLELRTPADGPWLLVRTLTVKSGEKEEVLIGGREAAPTGAAAKLLGGPKNNPPTYAKAPPEVKAPVKVIAAKASTARLSLPEFADMAENILKQQLSLPQCSPLRLMEGGSALAKPNSSCGQVRSSKGGRYCHSGESLVFSANDSSDPAQNGRAYTLALDETRACGGAWWIYPGDTMTTAPIEQQLKRLNRGGARLELAGRPTGPGDRSADVTVRLKVGGQEVFSAAAPVSDFAEGVGWDLPEATPSRALDVKLEVSTPAAASFLLLTEATLVGG